MEQCPATYVTYLIIAPLKVLFSIPFGGPESETKDLWRENVSFGGTRTMKLDPTWNKI